MLAIPMSFPTGWWKYAGSYPPFLMKDVTCSWLTQQLDDHDTSWKLLSAHSYVSVLSSLILDLLATLMFGTSESYGGIDRSPYWLILSFRSRTMVL